MELTALADWQTHHLMIFNVYGVRFNLHFVIWMAFLGWFMFWCKGAQERLITATLLGFQFLYIAVAFCLDIIDYQNVGSGSFLSFISQIKEGQERSLGIGLDAFLYACIDYLTILILITMRPRRIVDPITFVLVVLIVLHLVAAIVPMSSYTAYDILWHGLYYLIFAILFLTSGRVEKKIGHIRLFDICHFLARPDSSKVVHR
jgi:hypothetical protein